MRRLRPPTLRPTETPKEPARPAVAANSTGLLAGAVSSGQLAITQEADWATSNITTTDTTNWTTIAWFGISIAPGPICLFAFANAAWRHSVAGARVSFRLAGVIYQYAQQANLYAPAANEVNSMSLSFGYDVPSNIADDSGTSGGIFFQVKPITAGTVTIVGTNDDLPIVHAFTTGDLSR